MDKIVGDVITRKVQQIGFGRVAARTIFMCVCAVSFLISVLLHATAHEVNLALLSPEGEPLEQIAAGVPFQLAVTVSDFKNTGARPEIVGIEQFVLRSTGFSMTTMNGKSTTKFLYTVSCDTPGVYLIGPAQVAIDGKTVQSGQVRVLIGERTVTNQPASSVHKQSSPSYFLRVQLDKEQLFVGEPVRCAVRLYTARDGVSVKNITKPTLPGFIQREALEQASGTEQIQGKTYAYHEWCWQLVPQEAGKKIIPAFCADIEQPTSFHSLFAHMSAFMQMPGEHARIYSDALTVSVNPLPAHDGPVHVMGTVDSFKATIEPAVAKEGEGSVLTLRISGGGDIAGLDSFALQAMPEQLKWYDSKNYVAPSATSRAAGVSDQMQSERASGDAANSVGTVSGAAQEKVFEYIVQGLAAGEYEIPAQTCTYFDLDTRTYKIVQTAPLRIAILASSASASAFAQKLSAGLAATASAALQNGVNTVGAGAVADVATTVAVGAVLPLASEGNWYASEKRGLPWWLFITALGFFVVLGIVRFVRYLFSCMRSAHRARNKKKQAIKSAHAALQKLARTSNCAGVYPVFISLFSVLLDTQESVIHDMALQHALEKTGLSEEQLQAWQLFFSRAAEFSFYAPQVTPQEQEEFFKSAHTWLDLIAARLGGI